MRGRDRQVLRGVTLSVRRGEAYGLVGESGCGKSTAALAVVQYLPRNGRVRSGEIRIDDRDVLSLSREELLALRADAVSMVYQNPSTALNPSLRIGNQVGEVFTVRGVGRAEAVERAEEALRLVQISAPGSVMNRYPHQLSGGMQQRVIIAMALAKDPSLLILDEPTTGLDATVEAEVLDLVAALQAKLHTSVLFISHNLGVIAKMCDRVGVLYAGRLVEEGTVARVLRDPRHPYTVGLLRCIPRGARITAGSTRFPASRRTSATSSPAASSPRAAHSRNRSVTTRSHPCMRWATGTSAAATSTTRRRRCRVRWQPTSRCRLSIERSRRCCASTISARSFTSTATRSRRSQGCRPRSGRARRSVSSASRGAARRRSHARCSASSGRHTAPSSSTARRSPLGSGSARERRCARSRSSSRTRTRPSTAAIR